MQPSSAEKMALACSVTLLFPLCLHCVCPCVAVLSVFLDVYALRFHLCRQRDAEVGPRDMKTWVSCVLGQIAYNLVAVHAWRALVAKNSPESVRFEPPVALHSIPG